MFTNYLRSPRKVHHHHLYVTFKNLWKSLLPDVIAMKPKSDLCFACQTNTNIILKATNSNDKEKSEALLNAEKHLRLADIQRDHYKNNVEKAKNDITTADVSISSKPPKSFDGTGMYSFDFAQMVQYPCNPQQPGAIFFKVPRKCHIFGINNEGLNRQTNYLIDEAVDCGKGSNSIISYLHHFFTNFGLGERNLVLQADNCAGQNKNNFLMQYLSWRISQGFHENIELNFMLAGHTKFSPDRCFGCLKKLYAKTFVSSLFEVADAVMLSSDVGTNVYELAGLPDGTVLVPVYNWQIFFEKHFKSIPQILKYHHFRFTEERPGVVFVKEFADSAEIEISLLKGSKLELSGLPSLITPNGLSEERKYYLYNEIRPFCRPGTEDLVAPFHKNPKKKQKNEPKIQKRKNGKSTENKQKRNKKNKK